MNGTTTTILAAGCTLGGITIGVIAVSVTKGGITPDTMYGTGLGLAIVSVGLLVTAYIDQRFNRLDRAMAAHKQRDREALREVLAWNGDESGPNQVHHIRR